MYAKILAIGFLTAAGCDAATPQPSTAVEAMCVGYMVTSQCPAGTPTVDGLPAIGCHDDLGVFHSGCIYNAGPAGHETTSICVTTCPVEP